MFAKEGAFSDEEAWKENGAGRRDRSAFAGDGFGRRHPAAGPAVGAGQPVSGLYAFGLALYPAQKAPRSRLRRVPGLPGKAAGRSPCGMIRQAAQAAILL